MATTSSNALNSINTRLTPSVGSGWLSVKWSRSQSTQTKQILKPYFTCCIIIRCVCSQGAASWKSDDLDRGLTRNLGCRSVDPARVATIVGDHPSYKPRH
ncbi:hypothetical protein TNCV_2232591 [Trichonephila clavipes]|nr:hypothetical protein TNCV_2232591 [Trichonephila clavipes]